METTDQIEQQLSTTFCGGLEDPRRGLTRVGGGELANGYLTSACPCGRSVRAVSRERGWTAAQCPVTGFQEQERTHV